MKPKEGPDRGWSWVIAFSSFLISLILFGIYRTSGILLVAFVHEYGVTREDASWPLFLCFSLVDISGLVTGPLGQRFGIRSITIIGSLISAIGVSLCYFARSLTFITVSFGIIFGIGYGLAYNLMNVIINQYFLNYRATANGIANSGACFGSVIFPPLYEHLLSTYGLNGCLLLVGGIILQLTISGTVMKPPWWIENETNADDTIIGNNKSGIGKDFKNVRYSSLEKNDILDNYTSSGVTDINQYEEVMKIENRSLQISDCEIQKIKYGTPKNRIPIESLKTNTEDDVKNINQRRLLSGDKPDERLKGLTSRENSVSEHGQGEFINFENRLYEKTSDENSKMEEKTSSVESSQIGHEYQEDTSNRFSPSQSFENDLINRITNATTMTSAGTSGRNDKLFDSENGLENENALKASKPCLEIEQFQNDRALDEQSRSKQELNVDYTESKPQKKSEIISILLSFKHVLTCPMFYVIAISNVVFFSNEEMFFVINVDFYVDKGIAEEDAKYLIFVFSISDLIGRLCLGWITDRKFVRRSHFLLICMAIVAALFFCFPFANGYASLLVLNSIYGLILGCTTVIFCVIPVDYLDMDAQEVAFGCIAFLCGVLTLMFSLLIGYFRDHLGSYSTIFYLMGAVSLLSSGLWLLENVFTKPKSYPQNVPSEDMLDKTVT